MRDGKLMRWEVVVGTYHESDGLRNLNPHPHTILCKRLIAMAAIST